VQNRDKLDGVGVPLKFELASAFVWAVAGVFLVGTVSLEALWSWAFVTFVDLSIGITKFNSNVTL